MKETIEVEIVDKVAPTIKHKLDELDASANAAQSEIDRLQASINKLNQAGSKAATSSARLQQAESNAAKSAAQAALAQERLNQARMKGIGIAQRYSTATATTGSGGGFGSLLKGVSVGVGGPNFGGALAAPLGSAAGGALAGGFVLKEATEALIEYADAYNVVRNRVQTMTGSLETAEPAIDRIRQIANATAAPLDSTAESVVRFDRALKPLGKTQEEVYQFTTTLQTMLYRFGKSASESASATLQLTQAMGKGKLDGDEFRSVMENLPELGTEIAKSLGVTRGELLKLAPEGKITGDVIFNAMVNARASLDKLPQPIETVDASFTRLKNNATQFFGELEIGQVAVGLFTGAINALSKALEKSDAGIDNIEARVAKLRKENEEAAKNVSQPGNEAAKRDAERAKSREDYYRKTAEFAQEITSAQAREIELLGMSERERAGSKAVDAARLKAKKEDVELTYEQTRAIEEQAKKIFDLGEKTKTARGEKGPDRASILAKINAQLDNELSRMTMLEEARNRQAKFDQIEESLLGKKIKLTESEALAIRDKIQAISELAPVQVEYDRIVSDANDPAKRYAATFEGATLALNAGKISLAEFNREMELADRALESYLNPSAQFTRELEQQIQLSRFSNREREIETQLLDRANQLRAEGRSVSLEEQQSLRASYELLRANNELRNAEAEILGNTTEKQRLFNIQLEALVRLRAQIGEGATAQQAQGMLGDGLTPGKTWMQAALQNQRDYYAQVDAMRQADLITEQEAENAKLVARQKTNNLILDHAKGFFSNFEGMQRSNVNEIAAIGKAAAIANATINAYQAANAAYASMASIPGVGPALGAAAAAGAIASGMANVAAIAAQPTGFKSGGYTGNGGVNDVAGVVHGREYVFDAASTARIGRDNLDAMRSGAPVGNSGGQAQLNLTLIVVSSKEEASSVASQAAGETMVIDVIGKNSRKISRMLGVKG